MLPPFWKTPRFIKRWVSFWETQKVKQRFINNAPIRPTPSFWLNPESPCVFQKVKFIPITFYKTETTFCVFQKVMSRFVKRDTLFCKTFMSTMSFCKTILWIYKSTNSAWLKQERLIKRAISQKGGKRNWDTFY